MNEIWLVYRERDYTYDISNIVSFANSEQDADEKIKEYENICKQKPKINVDEKFREIDRSLVNVCGYDNLSILSYKARTEYIDSIPFEEYLKWKCGKNAKFNKTTIKRSV